MPLQAPRAQTHEDRWLLVESFTEDHHRPANMVRASIIAGTPCMAEGVEWLVRMCSQRGRKADWALTILNRMRADGLIAQEQKAS